MKKFLDDKLALLRRIKNQITAKTEKIIADLKVKLEAFLNNHPNVKKLFNSIESGVDAILTIAKNAIYALRDMIFTAEDVYVDIDGQKVTWVCKWCDKIRFTITSKGKTTVAAA